jgi:hypothetical protein
LPRLLVERFSEDTIEQFRVAAQMRYEEGWKLSLSGCRSGAIYLWGYTAEMTLKAAWFSLIGFPERRGITARDLGNAFSIATRYGIAWPPHGKFHALIGWGQLLVQYRIVLGRPYTSAPFANNVVEHSKRIYDRWRESMRYKKNVAYLHEVRAVADSVNWLLVNRHHL